MLTASVRLDLTTVPEERHRGLVGLLSSVPDGARAVLAVGSIPPAQGLVWLVAEHEPRLVLEIEGHPWAVRDWYAAVRASVAEVGR